MQPISFFQLRWAVLSVHPAPTLLVIWKALIRKVAGARDRVEALDIGLQCPTELQDAFYRINTECVHALNAIDDRCSKGKL